MLGKESVRTRSTGVSHSAKGGGSSENYGSEGKEMLSTDRLATMPRDECVLSINGMHPFYSKKYKLERHPRFKLSGDGDSKMKFDYKKEFTTKIVNSAAEKVKGIQGLEAGLDIFMGKPKPIKDAFIENHIGTVKEAAKNIIMKADDTKLVEVETENGDIEFDFSL